MLNRRYIFVVGILTALVGCRKAGPVQEMHRQLEASIEQANIDQWARECAPMELALAETHKEFAETEFEQGDIRRAEEHLKIANDNIRIALQKAEACRPHDRDGDGIMDDVDQCPDQPETVNGFKDEDGCPEKDSDGDGIFDSVDQCPNQPEDLDGFKDQDGCPDPDNDGDGILDNVDQCPNQPENINEYLDTDGCPDIKPQHVRVTQEKIEIDQKIHFETGKSKILPMSYDILDAVAQAMKDYPKIRVRIEGHTDSVGSDAYNMRLSQARAQAVFEYLVAAGIDASRLEYIGYGETRPIDTNMTAEGRARNRRVEFRIISGM